MTPRGRGRRTVEGMQSRLRLGGHAVQPLFLMFPLGLFAVALVLDLGTLLGAPAIVGTLAHCTIVAGLAGGALTAVAGTLDAGTARTPVLARRRFLILFLDLGVLVCFAVLALVRLRTEDRGADPRLFLGEVLTVGVAVASSWCGGRMNPNCRFARPPSEA